ncbi:penicillin acylase family protein [Streptomyces tuirus]|uniref:Penicillin acylase family protein n=1 Tax=Streptomyces tuirus TaxID=68278 RepID=A0A941FI97_9ACTN|nr:penicillin acylase family protein [Streptomyces tuirus]
MEAALALRQAIPARLRRRGQRLDRRAGGASSSGAKSMEYTVLGLQNSTYNVERWNPVDSLAWFKALSWELLGNMDSEIERTLMLAHGMSRQQIAQLYPPYPYTSNPPVVDGGAVVKGEFTAGPAPERAAHGESAPSDEEWGRMAPALRSIGEGMDSLGLRPEAEPASVGSNGWVVSGSRTASGKPLLANDPHLRSTLPGPWYQIGLHCTCSQNVEGASLPGIPGVVIGHNDRVAWGLTNLPADVTDLYLEKVRRGKYLDGSAWRKLRTRTEVIKVLGGKRVPITVRATEHGPLLSDRMSELLQVAAQPPMDASGAPRQTVPPGKEKQRLDAARPGVPAQAARLPYAVALRWTGFEPSRTMDALFAVNRSTGWKDFSAAVARFDEPAQNVLYADVDGHIGYRAAGRIPIRSKGDGDWPVPGWDPAYDWKGTIPAKELPSLYDPPDGVIVSANQPSAGPSYPRHLTDDWNYGYRARRIHDLLAGKPARGRLDVASMRQIQVDDRDAGAAALVPHLLEVPLGDDTTAAKARELLRRWDFRQGADSAAAAFYNATWRHLLERTFDELPADRRPTGGDRWWEVVRHLLKEPTSPWWDAKGTGRVESENDILGAAMRDAAAELTDRLGRDPADWRWGDLHTLTLRGSGPGESGIAPIEDLFNRRVQGIAGGTDAVNATSWNAGEGYEVGIAPSLRMITDLADFGGSRWVQTAGNSGHAFHDDYDDQLPCGGPEGICRCDGHDGMWSRPRTTGSL